MKYLAVSGYKEIEMTHPLIKYCRTAIVTSRTSWAKSGATYALTGLSESIDG